MDKLMTTLAEHKGTVQITMADAVYMTLARYQDGHETTMQLRTDTVEQAAGMAIRWFNGELILDVDSKDV